VELKEAIAKRRSIRAFRPDPPPKEVLEEIMERALRAPSWGNTQPWNFTFVGGQALQGIKEEYAALAQRGVPSRPDLPFPATFPEKQASRYREVGKALFTALGIPREDKERRNSHMLEMTRFFGAPGVIYLHLTQGFNPYALLDCGLILQTIALLAVDQGLGTCILTRSVSYADIVKKHAGIGLDQVLVMGMCIGYPLSDHPANQFRSERGSAEEFCRFVDVV
jgi:nitroreductase